MQKRSAYRLFGIVFVLSGVMLMILGVDGLSKGRESTNWPTTVGKVVTSEMRIDRKKTGASKVRTNQYQPRLVYSYAVNGVPYSSVKVGFVGTYSPNADDIKPILRRYPEGSEVTVYVNPDDPEMAILEPGVNGKMYIPIGIGVVLLLVGGGFVGTTLIRP